MILIPAQNIIAGDAHRFRVLAFADTKVLAVLTVLYGLGMVCLGVDADFIQRIINAIMQFSLCVLYLVGAVVATVGAIRKVKLRRWSMQMLRSR